MQPLTLELHYANYTAQPEIGFDVRRQGMAINGRYDVTKNYFLSGNVTFDMSRYLYNSLTTDQFSTSLLTGVNTTTLTGVNVTGTAPVFSIAAMGFGAGYHDECTELSINYTSIYAPQASTGLPARNQTVMLTLKLRTLGEIKTGVGLGSTLVNDGVRATP